MASKKNCKLSTNSEIVCKLEAALDDLLVVSYQSPNNKLYQGVLLDASQR